MDISGAESLVQRIAAQENWQQALSVRTGLQPAVDPDGGLLESYYATARYYRAKQRRETVEGCTALVTRRLRKHLVDGVWEAEVVVEDVQAAA